MDEVLHILNIMLLDVSLIGFGLFALMFNYPAQIFGAAILCLIWWAASRSKRLRRVVNWYLWFPIQRSLHRLYVPHRRKLRGFLMCKAKKSVVADKLDDALFQMVLDKVISGHDYRELCRKIGVAIGATDLVPKGKFHQEVIRQRVLMNCAAMHASLAKVPQHIPGAPEPAKPGYQTLNYLRNRNAA